MALPLVRLPLHHTGLFVLAGLVIVSTCVFMLLQVWLAQKIAETRLRPFAAVLWVVALTVLWLAVLAFLRPVHGEARSLHFATMLARSSLLGLSMSAGLAFAGMLLACLIRERNVLLPVALVAMPVDYVGAMTNVGFTHTVEKHAAPLVNAISVPVPTIGGLQPIAFIGPGDALFIAFFFAVVSNLDMNRRGTFWWMFVLLTVTLLSVFFTGVPVAALVPMGIAVMVANWKYFTLKREEVFAVLYAILITCTVVGAFYVVSHRSIERRFEGAKSAHVGN
jgi:hypothetical protein